MDERLKSERVGHIEWRPIDPEGFLEYHTLGYYDASWVHGPSVDWDMFKVGSILNGFRIKSKTIGRIRGGLVSVDLSLESEQ